MRQGRVFQYSIVAGWLITAIMVVLVATILIPENNRSIYFWHRVCWTEFLILLFWGSIGYYSTISRESKDHLNRFSGIAPSIAVITITYVLLSFLVMVIHATIQGTDSGDRFHLIAQIVLFTIMALCIAFLSMARAGAATNLDFDKTKAMSPRELHDLIAQHESLLTVSENSANDLGKNMKKLREVILYSFNESYSLAISAEYQSICDEILKFCMSIKGVKSSAELIDNYNSLSDSVNKLIVKARIISSNQIHR